MNDEQRSKSAAPKLLIGCGIGCLVLILLVLGLSFAGWMWIKAKYNASLEEFEARGFVRVESQIQDIQDEITVKTVYGGQIVKIRTDCQTDLAIVAQIAEVYGEVHGTLYFRGQQLFIKSTAKIHGDVDVFCQQVFTDGQIDGELVGDYQMTVDADGTVRYSGQPSAGETSSEPEAESESLAPEKGAEEASPDTPRPK